MIKGLREGWNRLVWAVTGTREVALDNQRSLKVLATEVERLRRETRLLVGQLSLPPAESWLDKSRWIDGAPAESAFASSTVCRQESFEKAHFAYWCRRLGLPPSYHRKTWEYVFICQALWERGLIRPGARGLGFGVGREPLSAVFASEGCDIVATDAAPDASARLGWSDPEQHAASLATIRYEHLCPAPEFDRHVSFRVCDMNAIADDLGGFDFCWSACAFEHLGSIEQGLQFVQRAMACVKPGGWAVHTTEFNLSSDDATLDNLGTVLFRRRDMEALAERLAAQGHRVAPFDFDPGLAPLDRYIDVPPYRPEPHLKLAIEGFATTSIGIIIQRA
jgi:2-polyprenyl-3-methyl-5-hydroxy-6-metoxy-1,4-benzoquinol methylase